MNWPTVDGIVLEISRRTSSLGMLGRDIVGFKFGYEGGNVDRVWGCMVDVLEGRSFLHALVQL